MHIEIRALRHQLSVLQRRTIKRTSLRTGDRLLWVILSRLWSPWRSALVIVKPESVIGWQRKGFRLYWRWKSKAGKAGRPGYTSANPAAEHRESAVGSTKDSWRVTKTRNSDLSSNSSEVYGAAKEAAVTNLAHVS
jgi:hypothetical protein